MTFSPANSDTVAPRDSDIPTPANSDNRSTGRPPSVKWLSRGWPRLVALAALPLLLWLALSAWAVMSPTGSSPDDDYHIANIYCAAGEATCTSDGERDRPCFALKPEVTADCLRNSGRNLPVTTGVRGNWYPPMYYATMSHFTADTVEGTVRSVRLVNAALAVALFSASVTLTARRLRRAVALSWLVSVVPLGMFLFASINPTTWSVIGIAAGWGPAVSFLTADAGVSERRRLNQQRMLASARVVFVGLTTLLALGARSEAPIFVTGVAVAVSILGYHPRYRLRLLLPGAMILAAAAFYLFYGAAKWAEMLSYRKDGDLSLWELTVGSFVLPFRGLGPQGPLGWLDTPMPALVSVLMVGAYASVLALGLRTRDRRKTWSLLAFLGVCLLGAGIANFQALSAGNHLQPRYFLPELFVFAGLAVLPAGLATSDGSPTAHRDPRISRLQLSLIASAVVIANSAALLALGLRFIRGAGPGHPTSLVALAERTPTWWSYLAPVGPYWVWLVGTLAFAAAVGFALGVGGVFDPWREQGSAQLGTDHHPNALHARI